MNKEPRYEIGGHLVDAHGVRHEIYSVDEGGRPWIIDATCDDGLVGPRHLASGPHYRYEPPQKAITIKPGSDLWELLETIDDKNNMRSAQSLHFNIKNAWAAAKGGAK